jgi:ACS family hexuronate transporter-like MFS transporter
VFSKFVGGQYTALPADSIKSTCICANPAKAQLNFDRRYPDLVFVRFERMFPRLQIESAHSRSAAPQQMRSRVRWWICGLLFLATTINYIDRAVLALLKPTLTHDLHWNEIDYGNIVFWFQLAYALGYLFAGRVIDLVGVRIGYAISVLLWSAAAMAHALARSVPGFAIARAALGLAEGGNFPAAVKTVSEWFPRKERALATGLFNAGANVGAVVTPLAVPWITVTFGWQAAFIATGALGLLWLVGWLVFYRQPEQHWGVDEIELALIRSDPVEPGVKIPWLKLLSYPAVCGLAIAAMCSGPVWWFYLYWVPDFLFKRHGLDLKNLGPPLVVIYLVSDVGSIAGGWMSSRLIKRGWDAIPARKATMLICAMCVIPVFFASRVSGLWTATLLIALAAAAHQAWVANSYTLVSDTMPRYAVSSVMGIIGFAGSIAGMFFAKIVGYVLEWTGRYTIPFAWAPCAYLIALLVLQVFLPRRTAGVSRSSEQAAQPV